MVKYCEKPKLKSNIPEFYFFNQQICDNMYIIAHTFKKQLH